MLRDRSDWLAVAGLSVAWLIPIALIGVAGDFPLSDDWAYAHSARLWVETGEIVRLRWTWAPIVTHVWVGGTGIRLFGDSFETHDQKEGMACFLSREKPKPKAVFTNN